MSEPEKPVKPVIEVGPEGTVRLNRAVMSKPANPSEAAFDANGVAPRITRQDRELMEGLPKNQPVGSALQVSGKSAEFTEGFKGEPKTYTPESESLPLLKEQAKQVLSAMEAAITAEMTANAATPSDRTDDHEGKKLLMPAKELQQAAVVNTEKDIKPPRVRDWAWAAALVGSLAGGFGVPKLLQQPHPNKSVEPAPTEEVATNFENPIVPGKEKNVAEALKKPLTFEEQVKEKQKQLLDKEASLHAEMDANIAKIETAREKGDTAALNTMLKNSLNAEELAAVTALSPVQKAEAATPQSEPVLRVATASLPVNVPAADFPAQETTPVPGGKIKVHDVSSAKQEAARRMQEAGFQGDWIDYFNNLAEKESSNNPRDIHPKTGAAGLWQTGSWKIVPLSEQVDQVVAATKENLKYLIAHHIEPSPENLEVLHQQGKGGGPALLDPRNANKNVVEVLTPYYREFNGRHLTEKQAARVAASAVYLNAGDVNGTAGEFVAVIKDYYAGRPHHHNQNNTKNPLATGTGTHQTIPPVGSLPKLKSTDVEFNNPYAIPEVSSSPPKIKTPHGSTGKKPQAVTPEPQTTILPGNAKKQSVIPHTPDPVAKPQSETEVIPVKPSPSPRILPDTPVRQTTDNQGEAVQEKKQQLERLLQQIKKPTPSTATPAATQSQSGSEVIPAPKELKGKGIEGIEHIQSSMKDFRVSISKEGTLQPLQGGGYVERISQPKGQDKGLSR